MEDLFRFILARPAQRADPKTTTIPVTPSGELNKGLTEVRAANDQPAIARRVAAAYGGSAMALHSLQDLKYGEGLQELAETLQPGVDRSPNELAALVKKLLGAPAADVLKDPKFIRDRERLSDVVTVNSILGGDVLLSSDDAANLLRAIAVVESIAANDPDISAKGGVAAAMEKTIVLPGSIFPLTRSVSRPAAQPPAANMDARYTELKTERDRLLSTYMMLTRVSADHIALPDAKDAPGYEVRGSGALAGLPPVAAIDRREEDDTRIRHLASNRINLAVGVAGASLRLKPSAVAAMSPMERTVLEERGLDLTRINLPTAVERLSIELGGLEMKIAGMREPTHSATTKLGSTYLIDRSIGIGTIVSGGFGKAPASVPMTHGSVAPAGIGDLLVVKQFLKRYEARELGHVENVLLGEYKERMHRRARTTEETITVETEEKKEEERDQQTTERFELKTESSQVQKEDTSLKIGFAISGKYGPVVEFKASTDFALNTSKEESSKVATSYSKDITTRATSKIFERRREERILKTIEVFEEKNTHGIDNKSGQDHVIGQYQWIDKLYEAQVFNYGKRLLFDIMLPEPAAFLLHAAGEQPKAGSDLVKPTAFTLKPTDLSEWNYAYYVQQYEAIGVEPPPEPYVTVSKALEGAGNDSDHGVATKAVELPVKGGYKALSGNVLCTFTMWEDDAAIDVVVGTAGKRFDKNSAWSWSFGMNNEVESVPVTVKVFHIEVFTVAVEIICQRTEKALDDWKLKTHASILQGYQKQLRDYEEKLAALQVQAAQEVQGRNPLENERLIRTELKKGATSVFTAQHYDLFGAISLSSQGFPQADLPGAEAEGKYIRFFEQAFEWEQMMYFFYPYFWGRKPNWLKRALLQDVDPLFGEFIKAGSARIVLSVRPGFEKAIAHFLDTGQIWNGGDLPDITSPLYVSIIEEIKERDKAPGTEIAQGDPWDVRLPTTLVILRDKPGLPEWKKNAQGEWLPV